MSRDALQGMGDVGVGLAHAEPKASMGRPIWRPCSRRSLDGVMPIRPRRNLPPKVSSCSCTSGVTSIDSFSPPRSTPKLERPPAVDADDALHVLEAFDGPAVDAGDHVTGLDAGSGGRHSAFTSPDRGGDGADAESRVDARHKPLSPKGNLPSGRRRRRRRAATAACSGRRRRARSGSCGRGVRRGLAGRVLVVDELHVAAERDPGEAPAGALAVGEAEDLACRSRSRTS